MSYRRKVELMSMWKEDNNRRRSPRLSDLNNACKADTTKRVEVVGGGGSSSNNSTKKKKTSTNVASAAPAAAAGPASRTRGRKKRKIRPLQDVAATTVLQESQDPGSSGDESSSEDEGHEHHQSNSDKLLVQGDDGRQATFTGQQSNVPSQSASWVPGKRVLELILNIIQRRDTHEIFGEPVDPKEVEDYYEIIEEPMDFGTMRAKLHEGMYTSLEQFEHDIFLISGNAMHFNSSTTLYFRQARAIQELAKKVFHAFKTDPENFEAEFSETKRRTGRWPQNAARVPVNSPSPKPGTNSGSNRSNISSKIMSYSTNGPPNLRKNIRGNPGCSSATVPFSARDHEMLSGARDGKRTSYAEGDPRCTYIPWTSFLNDHDPSVSTTYNNSKTLIDVNQQDISYRESLMLFVRDLGPTAQIVAERKLQRSSTDTSGFQTSGSNSWFQAPNFQYPPAVTSAQQIPTTLNTTSNTLKSQNFLDHFGECQTVPGNISGRTDLCDLNKMSFPEKVTPNGEEKMIPNAFRGDINGSRAVLGNDKIHKNGNDSNSSIATARELNFSVSRLNATRNKPATTESDKSKSDSQVEFSLRNNQSSSSSLPQQTTLSSYHHQTKGSISKNNHHLGNSQEQSQALKSSQPLPPVSQFTFDLPYLQTRLDQINNTPIRGKLFQHFSGTGGGGSILDKMNLQRVDNHHHQSSLDPKNTDLILQL